MAEPSAITSLLSEELKCPVCKELLIQARSLPCLHSLCTHCLQSLLSNTGQMKGKCPVCRDEFQVPKNGADGFKLDFSKNGMAQKLRSMARCLRHENQLTQIFCKKCKQALCLQCTLNSNHLGHEMCSVEAEDTRTKSAIDKLLKEARSRLILAEDNSKQMQLEINTCTKNISEIKETIEKFARNIIQDIEREKKTLISEIDKQLKERCDDCHRAALEDTKRNKALSVFIERMEELLKSTVEERHKYGMTEENANADIQVGIKILQEKANNKFAVKNDFGFSKQQFPDRTKFLGDIIYQQTLDKEPQNKAFETLKSRLESLEKQCCEKDKALKEKYADLEVLKKKLEIATLKEADFKENVDSEIQKFEKMKQESMNFEKEICGLRTKIADKDAELQSMYMYLDVMSANIHTSDDVIGTESTDIPYIRNNPLNYANKRTTPARYSSTSRDSDASKQISASPSGTLLNAVGTVGRGSQLSQNSSNNNSSSCLNDSYNSRDLRERSNSNGVAILTSTRKKYKTSTSNRVRSRSTHK